MSITLSFGWWLGPAGLSVGLLFLAVIVADRVGGGGAGAFFLTFPASLGAMLISGLVWWAYFAMGAP